MATKLHYQTNKTFGKACSHEADDTNNRVTPTDQIKITLKMMLDTSYASREIN